MKSGKNPQYIITRRRRLFFAVVATLGFFFFASAILLVLERVWFRAWQTEAEKVAYLLPDFLTTVDTPQGPAWRIEHTLEQAGATFLKTKPAKVVRIVFSGESFMRGTPYHEYGNIPGWVQAELESRFPSRRFEVINAAADGQNSSRVRRIIETLLPTAPDIVIVGMGNNDGLVPEYRLNPRLQQWVLYRSLKRVLLPFDSTGQRSFFTPQDTDVARVIALFQDNVRGIVAASRESHTHLVLLALPINYRYDGSVLTIDLPRLTDPADVDALREGDVLAAAGRFHEAIDVYQRVSQPAHIAQRLAKCHLALGNAVAARFYFQLSVELNPANRTRPSFNIFLRSLAGEPGVTIVDGEEALNATSPDGLPDPEWFFDYCHIHWRGYRLMAARLVDAIIAAGLIPAEAGEPLPRPTDEKIIADHQWQGLDEIVLALPPVPR